MLYYLQFALILIPTQLLMDIFLSNVIETHKHTEQDATCGCAATGMETIWLLERDPRSVQKSISTLDGARGCNNEWMAADLRGLDTVRIDTDHRRKEKKHKEHKENKEK